MNLEKIIAIRNAKTIYCDENNCVKVFNKEYCDFYNRKYSNKINFFFSDSIIYKCFNNF